MHETDDEIVEVYAAANAPEAHFVRNMLEEAGIHARVVGDALEGVILWNEDNPALVWARRSDQQRARELVVEYERTLRHRPAVDDDAVETGETWTCANCGEEVEVDFKFCWNCQNPRYKCPACGEAVEVDYETCWNCQAPRKPY